MKDLLIELGFEELPARFIDPAREQLAENLEQTLTQERIEYGEVKSFSTPRRLTVLVKQVIEQQDNLTVEVKGPPKKIAFQEGKPTKAALGFARSQAVNIEDTYNKEVNGVEYLFVNKFEKGEATQDVLARLLPNIVIGVKFPKNMRWGDYQLRFARPLRWIVALFNNEIISFKVENIQSGRKTYGHRQLAPSKITLNNSQEYLESLKKAYVIADYQKRLDIILEQVNAAAEKVNGKVLNDESLLNEVCNLVEYPTAFCGHFEREFLQIPQEVLITTMKMHQRYFSVVDSNDKLLPHFIGVRNGADNHLDLVTKGNEKVLKARLSDAKFFFEEDCQQPLDKNVEKLKHVVFQEGLGTVYDKVQRLKNLSKDIARELNCDRYIDKIERTAFLAKADLVSQMVNEFPELQGVMGAQYAHIAGEEEIIAESIKEHYKPVFSGGEVPQTILGTVVGIADKIDTLVGYFGIGKIPSGSQDPFALRRQALGVVQTLLEKSITISLVKLINLAIKNHNKQFDEKSVQKNLLEFFEGRIRHVFLDKGYRYDEIDAILASETAELSTINDKISVLNQFRKQKEFVDLMIVFERVKNLATKAHDVKIVSEKLTQEDEQLLKQVEQVSGQYNEFINKANYSEALKVLASLRDPIDNYFDAVMIMAKDEEVKENRLSLLQKIVSLMNSFADFSIIVIDM